MIALGRHILIEVFDADPDIINDPRLLESIFLATAEAANATVLSSHFHTFFPQGVSGVIIISESHITVHTWPEHGYAAVDFFFCDDKVDVDSGLDILADSLKAGRLVITGDFSRGLISASGADPAFRDGSAPFNQQLMPQPLSWEKKFFESGAKALSFSVDLIGLDWNKASKEKNIRLFAEKFLFEFRIGSDTAPVISYEGIDEGHILRLMASHITLTCRFSSAGEKAHIDLYSTGFFDPGEVSKFCMLYFNAERYHLRVALRH